MEIYIVEEGDNVNAIAEKLSSRPEDIIFDNQLIYPYNLAVGQTLLIENNFQDNQQQTNLAQDEVQTSQTDETYTTIPVLQTNLEKNFYGYAYPFISRFVLEQTLPYLSELHIFSYGFTKTGELVPPILDDQWMINLAYQYGTKPVLTLTPFDENGVFSNNLISALVNNQTVVANIINNLISFMTTKGFQALDIDFEYIYATDRDVFTDFVAQCTTKLNEVGFQVSVALAPKTSSEQKGLLYEGKDYAGLGAAANSVLLMTYEWGYSYSSPMAVAPINKVREVVEYALTQIPNDKISMGIPNYGYDWTLPYQKGVSKARTIGNVEATQLAINNNAEIDYDEIAQTPFFNYTANGYVLHEVWFEDVRSMNSKLDLLAEYDLRGAGYWQIMQLFRANWLLVASRFIIDK